MTYSTPPTTFDEMLSPYSEEIGQIARELREIVQTHFTDLDENIYGGKKVANALYSKGGPNNVLYGIQCGDKACKLFIHFFENVSGMGYKIEGAGKNARHIKFSQSQDIDLSLLIPILHKVRQTSGY